MSAWRSFLGRPAHLLPTPCLLVDLERFQGALVRMQEHAKRHGKALRPHAKTHKCADIAKRQLAAGAVGVCATKLSEAMALAREGVRGVLVTSPLVTRFNLEKLSDALALDPDLMAVVDSEENVQQLAEVVRAMSGAAASAEQPPATEHKAPPTLSVLVDIDGGNNRTGVSPSAGLALARCVHETPGLRLRGVQCYIGHIQHIKDFAARRQASLDGLAGAAELVRRMRADGLPCEIFTGTGTGTHEIDVEVPELTDMQVGSYCLMDTQYLHIASKAYPERFLPAGERPAMTLLTTVVSANHAPAFVTVDAGLKAAYRDGDPLEVVSPSIPGVSFKYTHWGDEHGRLTPTLAPDAPIESAAALRDALVVGRTFELVVGHVDPTVNLHDAFFVTDKGLLVDVWPIHARGKCQ